MKRNFNNIFKEGTRYKALFLSLLLCAIGSGLHKGILDNYVAEMAQMNELDRGIMEFFREVPGLLLVLILAIFYKSSAEKMYKLSMVFMAAGMVLQSVIDPVKALVILAIFIYSTGEHLTIEQPFVCDYGYNISVGEGFFANYNLVILDPAPVTFGDNVFIAPNCSFTTASHPLDAERRNKGLETCKPIHVGNNVWIGANVVVLPGVTIGDNAVIGAGSVVTRDIPAGYVAYGNPCKPHRKIENQ